MIYNILVNLVVMRVSFCHFFHSKALKWCAMNEKFRFDSLLKMSRKWRLEALWEKKKIRSFWIFLCCPILKRFHFVVLSAFILEYSHYNYSIITAGEARTFIDCYHLISSYLIVKIIWRALSLQRESFPGGQDNNCIILLLVILKAIFKSLK